MADMSPTIHEYSKEGNINAVLSELANGTDIDARDPENNRTPLMCAVSGRKATVHLVRLLVQRGANVNAIASDEGLAEAKRRIEQIGSPATSMIDTVGQIPVVEAKNDRVGAAEVLELPCQIKFPFKETALSIALSGGELDKVQTLLDAGADVLYERPRGYDALIDVMHGRDITRDPNLLSIIQLLIDRGARLNTVSDYSESALSVSSNDGRFDAVRLLLAAGADPAPLQWTPLMHAIALGSISDVRAQLKNGADLTARDFWLRTPWLLSLQTGDIAKAQSLLAAGADRSDRGRCGKTPLMYPIVNDHTEMLLWLLSVGFNANDVNDHDETPLMMAAELGRTRSAKILVEAGADIHRAKNSEPAVKIATNLEIARLLINAGADLNDINDEMRAALTKLPNDRRINVSRDEYFAAKHRCYGKSNPEKMNFAFWKAMVTSGADAYSARTRFNDTKIEDEPVWCFKRFGKSINELPDGRIIEIAGEHEDHYDPDFCIYNDVIVHHINGSFDIYGYPKECFPPTDFHTATLIERHIYIIGSLGYPSERLQGQTQVYRLNIDSLEIEKVTTSGEMPGWINEHKATHRGDGKIRISGGKVCAIDSGEKTYADNPSEYTLNLNTLVWTKD